MDFPSHDQLVARIDAFLARNPAISERQIGVDVARDSALVSNIRAGRDPRLSTLNKLADYMAARDAELNGTAASAASPGNPSEISGGAA